MNPSLLAKRTTATALVARLDADQPAARTITAPVIHDGVVKTKHLQPGQQVRPFVHGEPRGALRTVADVEKVGDGETFAVTFSSPHPDLPYKAAYRWFDESLVGSLVGHKVVKA